MRPPNLAWVEVIFDHPLAPEQIEAQLIEDFSDHVIIFEGVCDFNLLFHLLVALEGLESVVLVLMPAKEQGFEQVAWSVFHSSFPSLVECATRTIGRRLNQNEGSRLIFNGTKGRLQHIFRTRRCATPIPQSQL